MRHDMNVESWCQVEGNSNQKWTRATRRHDPNGFTSTAFEQEQGDVSKGRVDWSMANKPAQQKLAKKKHFPQKCKSTSSFHGRILVIRIIAIDRLCNFYFL